MRFTWIAGEGKKNISVSGMSTAKTVSFLSKRSVAELCVSIDATVSFDTYGIWCLKPKIKPRWPAVFLFLFWFFFSVFYYISSWSCGFNPSRGRTVAPCRDSGTACSVSSCYLRSWSGMVTGHKRTAFIGLPHTLMMSVAITFFLVYIGHIFPGG